MQTGTIGVTTENIFPVIKKFLYSDHEIFLRELVSNAIDATQKLKTLSSFGEFKGELGQLDIHVKINHEAGTLTISDHGVGMTAEDIDKYINQIAFSGAEEFLNKYKDTANTIIGHFGLGFYSAFMVAKKVEIISLSYKEGAKAVRWMCDGSPSYNMETAEKSDRGTDIVLYIDDESKQFLEKPTIDSLLKKYCRFLPIPVISGKQQEWEDGKMIDTDRDNIINNTEPRWAKKPSELTDDDYRNFYHELYPGEEDPLFWIHLNVDYPFNLTGILFFPKIKNNFDVAQKRIQLYCNSVYVTDEVKGVVPEFMTLLQGVIDSPDIPLNVSRSYLQSDTAVKKISSYITKKVASRLDEIFKNNRVEFEKKWDDIKIFIEYGMLSDSKFCEPAMKFVLLKDTEGQYYILDDYRKLIEAQQTDKDGKIVYLYTTDTEAQYTYIKGATDKGYSVLLMDGQLDNHFIGMLETKIENSRFVRVDSDIVENLIPKNDHKSADLNTIERTILTGLFSNSLSSIKNAQFIVDFEDMSADSTPLTLTQNEYMRRMKDMASIQPGMSFYGELPDNYTLVVNTASPLIERIKKQATEALHAQIAPLAEKINHDNNLISDMRGQAKNDQSDAKTQKQISDLEKILNETRQEQDTIISNYAKEDKLTGQLIDLALLRRGLLNGANLDQFIDRSIKML